MLFRLPHSVILSHAHLAKPFHFSPSPSLHPGEPTLRAAGVLQLTLRRGGPGLRGPCTRTPAPAPRAPPQSPPPGLPPHQRPNPSLFVRARDCAAAEMAKAGRAPRRRGRRGPYSSLLPPAPPITGHAVTGAEAAAAAERGLRLAARILHSCGRGARLQRGACSPGRRAPSRKRSEVGRTRLRGRTWGQRRISGDSSAQSSLSGVQAFLPLCSAPRRVGGARMP